ncbi:hypothetical protein ALC62_14240 [Cyphomyrmex costatus]|uniref:Uncharacterized protein n=1 Tax=Cyphomyrmex costatus TaxID=456900 RepID=A0A151I952_9HYME|nr:hypothetical protein ALC62_14240 [Cyphomyrmex costatus]
MDGIVPPTSTRQPFGLYAATSARGITADRTARKKIQDQRMSINGMRIKASEQIKSAKSQNRKSRRKLYRAVKTVLH